MKESNESLWVNSNWMSRRKPYTTNKHGNIKFTPRQIANIAPKHWRTIEKNGS